MIDAAIGAGADVIKFQTYRAEEVMTEETPLAEYMKGDQAANFLDLARRLELSNVQTLELKDYTEARGAEFMSSPFDVPSVLFLESLGVKRLKIPSGETVNPFVMKAAARTGLPLIISTGMCTMAEVERAVAMLRDHGSGPVTILHCTTQYPADPAQANLLALMELHQKFDFPIGYSDHTPGIEISIAAVALGAKVIEKHFTTDRTLPGPDQAASLIPSELRALVDAIRNVEVALGHGRKEPYASELEVAKVARKSVVAARDLPRGHRLVEDDLTAKRPGTGIPALRLDEVLGRRLKHDVRRNSLLQFGDLENG